MADKKNVQMKETYTVGSGPLRGRVLFFNEVYPLDDETRKEVKDAGAGSDSQKQATALGFEDAPVVNAGPTSGTQDPKETDQKR